MEETTEPSNRNQGGASVLSFEIGKNIETGEPLLLNVKDVVASRTYIASETRFGKSHTARRIAEKILKDWVGQIGIIIIDPDGEYASLREKYPILIIGRDIPIQVETPTLLASTAAFMAEQILETGTSAIIDLSVVKDFEDGKDYVDKFLRRFFHLQFTAKKPYLVIMETAEDFAPESGAPGTRTCLDIAVTLTRRGGKHGIGILFVGHRPAWISKGILSQTPNKAIGRIEAPDMEALERYARIPRKIVEKLVPKTNEEGDITDPGPERGVFLFTGDWVQKTIFVKVGPVETTHLGATPEIIPRPIGDIAGVIDNVQKTLSQFIEKTKPIVASQAEIENKIKTELESKYKGKIETLERTAVERAERKYRVKIDELQVQLEKLSRSQALQPIAPITDVLEHPIVKTRMLQLDEKARDLLTWVEQEPGHTREELAARMVSSKDAIANMVDKINDVFHLQVIVSDGKKPLRYRSMLKRLYLTDVAKREIEELGRLQTENKAKTERLQVLEEANRVLRGAAQQSATQHDEMEKMRQEVTTLKQTNTNLDATLDTAKGDIEQLKKEAEVVQKLRELLSVGTSGVDIEKRLDAFRREVAPELQQLLDRLVQEGSKMEVVIDKRIEELVDQKVAEKMASAPSSGVIPTSVELEHKVTHFDFQKSEEHVKADTTTLQGRIIHLIVKGFFDERHNRKQIVEELSHNGWIHDDKEVDAALLELCGKGIFYRKISTGSILWYWLQPEAKQLIHT